MEELELPITRDVLEDPNALLPLMATLYRPFFDSPELRNGAVRSFQAILRNARKQGLNEGQTIVLVGKKYHVPGYYEKSLLQFISMTDGQLLDIYMLGPKLLTIFRSATQPIRERFINAQLSSESSGGHPIF